MNSNSQARSRGRPKTNVQEATFQKIRNHILDLQGEERVALPPYRKMSQQYGISHVTLTKVLKRIEAEGLITCRPGDGTYIQSVEEGIDPQVKRLKERGDRIALRLGNSEMPGYGREFWSDIGEMHEASNPHVILNQNYRENFEAQSNMNVETCPDVFHVKSPAIPLLAEKGLLEPLDPYLEGFDTSTLRSLECCKYHGETFALPQESNYMALFANTRLLEELGIDPETYTPDPQNILKVARLTQDRLPDTSTFKIRSLKSFCHIFDIMGKSSFPDDTHIDNPNFSACLEWILEISKINNALLIDNHTYDEEDLVQGKLIFKIERTNYSMTLQNPELPIRAYPLTRFPGGAGTASLAFGWAMKRDGDLAIHAWNWIRQITSLETQIAIASRGHNLPALRHPDVDAAYMRSTIPGMSDLLDADAGFRSPVLNDLFLDEYLRDVWYPAALSVQQGLSQTSEALHGAQTAFELLKKQRRFKEKAEMAAKIL